MKHFLLSSTFVFLLPLASFSQEKCGSHKLIEYRESQFPGYKAHVEQQFNEAKNSSPKRATYTIPVVFHVVYNTPQENLHDSVILNQLAILNKDYGRMNADTTSMRSQFSPVAGRTNIQFALAAIDPSGNPTTGITRTSTQTTSFGSPSLFQGSFADLEKVKSTADGGKTAWDQTKYLNIWICDMTIFNTPMLLGYATPPANLANWPAGSIPDLGDGVVLLYQCVGSNNPVGINGYDILGRTATHEVGHYLGLRHIWGDEDDCSGEDGIDDTPHAAGASEQDCNTTKNSCTDNIAGTDLFDMIENFMDYSAEDCQNSFTKGQAALMHGVMDNQRNTLVNNNNVLSLNSLQIAVSCYPNPATDQINISASSPLNSVSVYDINGKLVKSAEVDGTLVSIEIKSLQPGIYTLRTASENGLYGQQKFTVTQ